MLIFLFGGKISYIEVNFYYIFFVFKMNEVLLVLFKKSICIMNIWFNIEILKN